eukprot:scaffold32615_cov230-Isochrysis_galbana.AAC.1
MCSTRSTGANSTTSKAPAMRPSEATASELVSFSPNSLLAPKSLKRMPALVTAATTGCVAKCTPKNCNSWPRAQIAPDANHRLDRLGSSV